MKIDGQYHYADNTSHAVVQSKVVRGMNFPCSESTCILTFSTKQEFDLHLKEGGHVSTHSLVSKNVPVGDRIKQSWVTDLSGNLDSRKTGKNVY